ncbi:hypothetical protein FHW36_104328 [Chitinophaga polysaccharea]|uniref:Uncharacterized protein n=1 Tax=Chitinophaga polysaccharea TaxID=1293035 RepID=A0A561PR99_9BACT|nr:hypothetical protein [Chitinophaga polysaccharea]TWF40645.1 hypothetical protein FHW36_104328 [Chitinophaga polysaccharea]
MAIIKHFKRIQYIDYVIRHKATGDLESFARRNNISKTTLSEILMEMKAMGFPIKYDRTKRTYFYEEDGEMISCLFLRYGEVLERNQLKTMNTVENLCFSPGAVFEICKE